MAIYGGQELASAFRTVRGNTLQIAADIPEDRYPFVPAEGCMSVAALLAHIASGTHLSLQLHEVERKSHVSLEDFGRYVGEAAGIAASLVTRATIVEALTTRGEQFATWLEGLSEARLAERVTFPEGLVPPSKARFEMLLAVKEHEMHHRGQLMLIQRLLGVVPHLTRRRMEAMAARAAAAPAT